MEDKLSESEDAGPASNKKANYNTTLDKKTTSEIIFIKPDIFEHQFEAVST
jgi:hypothetical protein